MAKVVAVVDVPVVRYKSASMEITVDYELPFGKDVIKPGDLLKIKNKRGEFKFRNVAHNVASGESWVDVMLITKGSWHSFPISEIKSLIKPKRPRKTK